MAKLPIDTRTKTEKLIEGKTIAQEFRPYLGLSTIGHKCARALWYTFHFCSKKEITPRQQRLFSRGHREEPIIQKDLKSIGIVCHVDPDNQPEMVCGDGHIKGHCDDILTNVPDAPKTPHLGEYKTHNDKSFNDLKKNGLKKSKPLHYDQMVCYMYLLNLKRGLYIAVNKNTDERYYERIHNDESRAKDLIIRAEHIVHTNFAPKRIGTKTWYECKWCDHYEICHNDQRPLQNCRTCFYAQTHPNGKWHCSLHGIDVVFEQQVKGCNFHRFMKGL